MAGYIQADVIQIGDHELMDEWMDRWAEGSIDKQTDACTYMTV